MKFIDIFSDNGKPHAYLFKLSRNDLGVYARYYVNKNDDMFVLAGRVTPLDNFEDFVIHGRPDLVEYETTNGQWVRLSPEDFAETLRQDSSYNGGNIRLLACQSGMLDNGFAQQLADLMGVQVLAPTEALWINKNGETFVSDNDVLAELWNSGELVKQTGAWRLFTPRR